MANLNVNGTIKSTGGGSTLLDVDLIEKSGTNYIRYNNGIQICWGYFDNGSNINDKTGIAVSFDKPFISQPAFVCASGKLDNSTSYRSTDCNYYSLSTSSATFGWYGNTARTGCWISIGKYK